MNEQQQNLDRVRSQIARHIVKFLEQHREFHGDELRRHVEANVDGYIAPASPDRILRDLRQKNVVNYEVANRAKSLYRTLPVRTEPRQESLF